MKNRQPAIAAFQSTLTSKYQITVPSAVRSALQVGKNDVLSFELTPDGVKVKKAEVPAPTEERRDPVLEAFLALVAKDISSNPASLGAYSEEEAEDDLAFLKTYKERNR
jgi:antitoxin PrlF